MITEGFLLKNSQGSAGLTQDSVAAPHLLEGLGGRMTCSIVPPVCVLQGLVKLHHCCQGLPILDGLLPPRDPEGAQD